MAAQPSETTVKLTRHAEGYLVNALGERVDEYGRLTRARGARGGAKKHEEWWWSGGWQSGGWSSGSWKEGGWLERQDPKGEEKRKEEPQEEPKKEEAVVTGAGQAVEDKEKESEVAATGATHTGRK